MEYEVRDILEAYEIIADCAGSDEPDFEVHLKEYESSYEEDLEEYDQDKYKVFIKHKGGILHLKGAILKPYLFYYDMVFELKHINNKPRVYKNNSEVVDIDWHAYDEEEIEPNEDLYKQLLEASLKGCAYYKERYDGIYIELDPATLVTKDLSECHFKIDTKVEFRLCTQSM